MIVYGVMLLALLTALGGIYGKGRSDGHAAEVKVWEPKLQAMKVERDDAVSANTRLARDVDTVRGEAKVCTAKVETLQTVGKDARSAVALAFAERDARQKANEAKVAGYEAGARAAPTGTKEQQCDAARAVLLETSALYGMVLGPSTMPAPVPQPAPTPEPPKVVIVPPAATKPLPGAVKLPVPR